MSLIELQHVTKNFEDLTVLKNVQLSLEEESSLVLVGPSGSGKSLLLKLMAGLVSPTSGKVLYKGKPLDSLSKKEWLDYWSQVGMLFQQNALFDSLTVYNNLDFVLREVKPEWSASQREKEIVGMLEAVGLDHVLKLYPGELSGGMQKRLGIARALVLQPKIVFYDDPTAGLDPITSRQIIQMILDLKEKIKATIVTVTHDMMRAYQLAGNILVCFHGDLVLTGSAEQTKAHPDPRVQQFIQGQIEGPLAEL